MPESNGSQADAEAVFVDPAKLRQLTSIPDPYYRVERRAAGAEVHPTERLYKEHLAENLTAIGVGCVLVCSGVFIDIWLNPSHGIVALPGMAVFTLLVVWVCACRNMKTREDCRHPLVVSGQGEISYKGAFIIAAREINYLQVRYSQSVDPSDYRVVAVTVAGQAKELPTPHFGGFSESGPPAVLAGLLALLLDRPMQDKVEIT